MTGPAERPPFPPSAEQPCSVHEYDDDWPFMDPDVRHLAPGSRPGDLCVWCLEPKQSAAPAPKEPE